MKDILLYIIRALVPRMLYGILGYILASKYNSKIYDGTIASFYNFLLYFILSLSLSLSLSLVLVLLSPFLKPEPPFLKPKIRVVVA